MQGSVEAVQPVARKAVQRRGARARDPLARVGAVTENDVMLASASKRHYRRLQRPSRYRSPEAAAERDNVDMRMYRVIYDCIEEIERCHEGYARAEVPVRCVHRPCRGAPGLQGHRCRHQSPAAISLTARCTATDLLRVVREGIIVGERQDRSPCAALRMTSRRSPRAMSAVSVWSASPTSARAIFMKRM